MKRSHNHFLKCTTSAAALLILVNTSSPVLAQATVDLDFTGTPSALATVTGSYSAVEDQLNDSAIAATTSGNTVNVTATASGAVSMSSVTGTLSDNSFSSTASANVTEANVLLDLSPSGGTDTAGIGVLQDTTSTGTVSAASSGNVGLVVIEGAAPSTDEVTFTGSILADNNDISATANGNIGVTKIAVSGGVSLTGTASGAVVAMDEGLTAALDSDTEADLVISSAQRIDGTVTASSTNDDMTVILQSVAGSTATLSNSDVDTAANGNDYSATLSITDGSTNTIGASAALTSLQDTDAAVSATTSGSDITLNTGSDSSGGVTGNTGTSTLTVTANGQTSAAYGNDSSQALSISANTLSGDVGSGSISDSASGTGGVQLSASADLAVASVQTQSAAVSASTSGNTIAANADDEGDTGPGTVDSTTVTVTSNTQSAFAMGADTDNTLTITSNAASATGAVAAVQANDSTVSADVTGSNVRLNVGSGGTALGSATGSTFELSGNKQSATAAGAQAVNTLTLSAGSNNLDVDANSGSVAILADAVETADVAQPTVTSAYALSNDQSSTSGSVTATVTNSDMDLVFVGGASGGSVTTLVDSTTINDSNTQSATAYGLTAGNSISLSFNNLEGTATTVASGAVVAGVANQQTQSGATVTATNTSTDNRTVLTNIDDNIQGSSLSTSSNMVTASAFGNRTTANSVTVDATNMVLSSGQVATPTIGETTGDITAPADIVAASSQEFENGSVTATQVSGSTSNWVYTDVSGTVNTSTVASDSNRLTVAATANTANNATSIGTVTTSTLEASSADANYQDVTSGSVTATLGTAGTAASKALSSSITSGFLIRDPSAAGGGVLIGSDGSTVRLGVGDALSIDVATLGLTEDEQAALIVELTSIGFTGSGTDFTLSNDGSIAITLTFDLSAFTLTSPINVWLNSGSLLTFSGFDTAATAYSPNTAGVIIETEGTSITDSTVTVMSNTLSGAVTGNTATNSVTVSATTLTGNNLIKANATDITNSVYADHALSSVQSVDTGTDLNSNVFGAFGSLQATDQTVSGSTLTVSNNTQTSTGTANTVTNTVSLTGSSSTDANSALFNEQTSNGDVTTGSDMEVFANAGMNASTLSLNSNVNESVATSNAAINSMTLSSADALSSDGNALPGLASTFILSDTVLLSYQTAGGTSGAAAVANTTVFNNDLTDTTGGAIDKSTIDMDGNRTSAQATSNSATNTLTLNVDNMDTSGALGNYQSSSQPTSATTTTSVALNQQNSSAVSLLSGSTASVDSNSATARATGNSSTNTVTLTGTNVDAGSTGTDVSLNTSGAGRVVADAAYLLVNETSNTGAVTATSTSTTYKVELQSAGGTVLNSGVSLSSNTSTANAVGNSASSAMNIGQDGSLTSISSNAGVVNSQTNTAAINASASATVQAALDTTGAATNAVDGSSLNVDSNSTVAMARGNVSTNILNVAATLADGGTGSAGSMTASTETLTATYGVLNAQTNNGAVTGTVSNVSYQALTNQEASYGGGAALNGSSISVTGNIVQAYGYGNISTNGVNMTPLTGGANDATLAAGNIQTNTGAISSTISGSNIGSTSLGTVTGSRLSVGGNNLASTAVGNFAITTVLWD